MTDQAEKPRLIIVAGPNGSGKTTITERGLAHEWFGGCEYINPDIIASDELKDASEPAIRQAASIAAERRNRCVAERRSLALESVFSGDDKIAFLRSARQQGFLVRVFFVSTSDPTINAARVARRVMQGGHEVPISKIVSRYFKSIANCAAVAAEVDRLYVYDNSPDDQEARLLFRAADGKVVKQYVELPPWTAPIRESLQPSLTP